MAGPDVVITPGAEWKPATPDGWTDVTYDVADGIAKITICRPEVRNAFRPRTLFELRDVFEIARDDPEIGVIILTGEGPEAFCSGSDQRIRGDDGYRDDKGIGRLNVLDLQVQIGRLPKPVIASSCRSPISRSKRSRGRAACCSTRRLPYACSRRR
jgi:naphthoate synthase